MAHLAHDPRLVPVPAEHREYAGKLLRELGPRAASKRTKLGRSTLLAIVALGECMRGSAALLQDAYQADHSGCFCGSPMAACGDGKSRACQQHDGLFVCALCPSNCPASFGCDTGGNCICVGG